jgi:hypothetical protein
MQLTNQSSSPVRRRLLLAGAAGMALFMAGCASAFSLAPDHVTFSRGEVQRAVARKFPYQKQVGQLADVVFSNPLVSLMPAENRVAVQVDAHLGSALLQEPVDGSFTVSGQLVYDPARNAIVIHAPAVDNANFSGNAQMLVQEFGGTAGLLVANLLNNYPVYTFKPGQLDFAGMHYAPGAITVQDNGIRIEIVQQ